MTRKTQSQGGVIRISQKVPRFGFRMTFGVGTWPLKMLFPVLFAIACTEDALVEAYIEFLEVPFIGS